MRAGVMLLDMLDRVEAVVFSAVHHSRRRGRNKNFIFGFLLVLSTIILYRIKKPPRKRSAEKGGGPNFSIVRGCGGIVPPRSVHAGGYSSGI